MAEEVVDDSEGVVCVKCGGNQVKIEQKIEDSGSGRRIVRKLRCRSCNHCMGVL